MITANCKKLIRMGNSYYLPVPIKYIRNRTVMQGALYNYTITINQHEHARNSDETNRTEPK